MATLSQKTLVEMMRLASQFGLYEAPFGSPALVSPTEMRRYLFARNFPNEILDEFERQHWDFDTILPAIKEGSFGKGRLFKRNSLGERIVSPLQTDDLLLKLAEAFLFKANEINQRSVYGALVVFHDLMRALDRDGFRVSGEHLVEADSVIDKVEQLTEFERALERSAHDNGGLVRHHLKQAEQYQASGQWGAAASEWRHVFEESIRGAWRFTRTNHPDFATRIEKPPFRDVLNWLELAGFLSTDERDAIGAGFGFLSAGNHPGIKGRQLAYLSQTLALPLAYTCLVKLNTWNGRSFDEAASGKWHAVFFPGEGELFADCLRSAGVGTAEGDPPQFQH